MLKASFEILSWFRSDSDPKHTGPRIKHDADTTVCQLLSSVILSDTTITGCTIAVDSGIDEERKVSLRLNFKMSMT